MGAAPYRAYATLGASAGAIVASVYWISVVDVPWWGATCELVITALGAALGAVTGDGSVKEVWAGRVGAFLVPLVALAFATFALAAIGVARG